MFTRAGVGPAQVAVLREADFYHKWAPFSRDSRLVHEFSKTDIITWFHGNVPFVWNR
jgi:hypothetical protein